MYRYLDHPRLQLFFPSPNICAAWLVILIVLLFGVAHACFLNKKRIMQCVAYCLSPVIIIFSAMLCMTYSRGGYVSLLLSMSVYSILIRSRLALTYIALLLFGICAFLPSGATRILSSTHLNENSIKHRIMLWRGGCGLTAMRPCRGWIPSDCGRLYAQWYRPKEVNENYHSMISDYLTISARHGLPVLLFLLIIIFTVLWFGGHIAHMLHDKILAALVCSCLSYLICACFTTLFEHTNVVSWFICLIIITACYITGLLFLERSLFRFNLLLIPFFTALFISGAIWLTGCLVNASMHYRLIEYRMSNKNNSNSLLLTAYPDHPPKALIVFFLPAELFGEDDNIYGLPSFREWLKSGYAIMSVALKSGLHGLDSSRAILANALETADGLPVLAIGVGTAGNFAILNSDSKARTKGLRGFIGIGASLDWPWDILSPMAQIKTIDVPGYLIDARNNTIDSFLQVANDEGKSIQGLLLDENTGHISISELTDRATPFALQIASILLNDGLSI